MNVRGNNSDTCDRVAALLNDISYCPFIKMYYRGRLAKTHPCWKIIASQRVRCIYGHLMPEPWSGHMRIAPVVFIGPNPSISSLEYYPDRSWPVELVQDFFINRFSNGSMNWTKEGLYFLRKEGFYHDVASRYWASVRSRAVELLGRDAVPGMDYILTEIVHCKSQGEEGVRDAAGMCSRLFLDRTLSLSVARIVVCLGRQVAGVVRDIYEIPAGLKVSNPIMVGNIDRCFVLLPHPNARGRRTFLDCLEKEELTYLQRVLSLLW